MNENDVTEFDDEIMQAAGALATDVAPERDLWPEIESAISEPVRRHGSPWNTVWAQAAAVLLLVGGSSGLTYLAMSGDDPIYDVPPAGNGVTQLVFEPVSGSFGSQYNLGTEYQVAHGDLDARLNEQLETMSPDVREDILKNIATIRDAIREINIALAKEPDNVLLQELLLSTYKEEMDLMIKVDDLTSSFMRREDI